ncbi:MAG: hypothetical protein M1324_01925 [Patescibacteria group bacterium]|nr:hypothetical protein [Patescibacteria group bacterium]
MEANEDEEQQLNSEVAEIKRRLETIQNYLGEHCPRDHQLKKLWVEAALSALQGYINVDNPPKRWESNVRFKGEEKK